MLQQVTISMLSNLCDYIISALYRVYQEVPDKLNLQYIAGQRQIIQNINNKASLNKNKESYMNYNLIGVYAILGRRGEKSEKNIYTQHVSTCNPTNFNQLFLSLCEVKHVEDILISGDIFSFKTFQKNCRY